MRGTLFRKGSLHWFPKTTRSAGCSVEAFAAPQSRRSGGSPYTGKPFFERFFLKTKFPQTVFLVGGNSFYRNNAREVALALFLLPIAGTKEKALQKENAIGGISLAFSVSLSSG